MRRVVVLSSVAAIVSAVIACREPRHAKEAVDECKPWEAFAKRRFADSLAREGPAPDGELVPPVLDRAVRDPSRYSFTYDDVGDCCLFEANFIGAEVADGGVLGWDGSMCGGTECLDKTTGALVRKRRY